MKHLKIIFNYLAMNAVDNAIVITSTVKTKKHVLCVIIKNLTKRKAAPFFSFYLFIAESLITS